MACIRVGLADQMVEPLAPHISSFLAQQDQGQFEGVPLAVVESALTVMIPDWFQRRASPGGAAYWTVPRSVIIGGAIGDRLEAIEAQQAVWDFYASLGKPAAWFTFNVVASSGKSLAEVSQYFSLHWTPKSKLARAVSTILGRPLTPEEELGDVHTSDLLGKWCQLKIACRRRSGYGQRCTLRVAEIIPVLQVEQPDVEKMERSIARLGKRLAASNRS